MQATVPVEVLALDSWLPWLALPRANGRLGKVPSLPRDGVLRPIDCRGAGLSLPEAHALMHRHRAGGLGIVLATGHGLAVLDLDVPITACTQTLLGEVLGYTGRSPGGGTHVWLAGNLPRNRRQAGIEVIGRGFVTVTGDALGERGQALGKLDDVLQRLGDGSPSRLVQSAPLTLSDEAVLGQLYAAKNGARARHLLTIGDWVSAGYHSASEGDLAAVRLLRFWTTDPEQLGRLMEGTALWRPKWTQGGYLARTIERALEMGGPTWAGSRVR
ncbi:hypothetical protein SAMN00790413_02285 [Deinococcus hopiensis KR-140]|uniref:NrS-1 polymerase-like HBD domain-containing protein n=1 Tax=Deinococcus hopiensis KR-140 TaxID=695939 RepID=A0A1W1VLF3_9DEIO|nr:hypothetical protein SAMN00790413_02285 [Deinococcus hopiensis KR-140]